MLHQRDMTEGKVVAVWLGDLATPEALDEYFREPFERDHGFTINDRAAPEISEPDGQGHTVRELLTGFSFHEDWLEDAVRLCEQAGWRTARAAAVFDHLRYRPELCQHPTAPMRFVANVPWRAHDNAA